MKRSLILMFGLALLATGILGAHEGGDSAAPVSMTAKRSAKKPHAKLLSAAKKKAPEKAPLVAKKEHWVCPMHDGGESDHPGKCKKCGMDLVLEKD